MAEPDWLELAWKLSGSGMSKTRFAEVYADKISKVPAGSHSAKVAVAALAPEPTNDAVSDERLREAAQNAVDTLVALDERMHDAATHKLQSTVAYGQHQKAAVSEAVDKLNAALTRRSVTSQASEGAGLADRLQAFIWEIEPKPQVVTPSKTQKIARRLRTEVVEELRSILSSAPVSKRVERLETALKPFADFVPNFFDDGYQDDDIVSITSHHGGLDLTLTVDDFRRAAQALQGGRS